MRCLGSTASCTTSAASHQQPSNGSSAGEDAPTMEPTEPTALTPGWRAWGRMLAAGTAVTFAAGTLLSALDALNVTTPEPEFAKGADLPSRILTTLENQSERFAWVLAATLLAAASFALLAALGPV